MKGRASEKGYVANYYATPLHWPRRRGGVVQPAGAQVYPRALHPRRENLAKGAIVSDSAVRMLHIRTISICMQMHMEFLHSWRFLVRSGTTLNLFTFKQNQSSKCNTHEREKRKPRRHLPRWLPRYLSP